MRSHIIDELRPVVPDLPPTWESETRRAILDSARATRSTPHRLLLLASAAAVVAALAGGAVFARNSLSSNDTRPVGPASQGPPSTPTTTPRTQETTGPTPRPERTYVPAPGDPKTHELNVTIRDKGISYTPGTCAAIRGNTDFQDRLGFSGPDKQYENRPLKDAEFTIPKQGTRLADGTCEATLTVTIPYAPRYRAGISREGHGISGPDDAGETLIAAKGDSQDVVVMNYPH
ncbi:hypothetical protein [Aeromicrobium ginsengisoli]|uniref:Uncharacterized protein n=1 Tax=Aeromicrobium ginsengisoli TaxID=363867 RepID=A0A5M4FE24_9ACTN|nr:hypothetical protein [Aeromicrobium ginsengisoli]KAA1397524.1 hypothetical protein ESP70_009115 [Aeromicrobium ginsengisoli]